MRMIIFILAAVSFATNAQDSTSAEYYFERAQQAMSLRDYTKAIRHYTTGLQLMPGHFDGYLYRGMARNNIEDFDGALTDFSIYLTQYPTNTEALFQRGFLHYTLEHFDLAKIDFELLLTLDESGETTSIVYRTPSFQEGVDKVFTAQDGKQDYILNYLGLSETKLSQYDSAIIHFTKAIELNDRDPNYYVHRGLAYQSMGNYVLAKQDYRQALVIEPNHGLALNNLAVISYKGQETDSIEYYLSAAIERSPNLPYPYAERGYYWLQQKKYEKAIEDYTEAIRIMPQDHELWLNRAIAKSKIRDLQGALADLDRVITLKPASSQGFMNRGNIYTQLKEYRNAIEDYTVAIVYDPEYGLAFYNRAIAYRAIEENEKSCNDLRTAERLGIAVSGRLKNSVCREP